MDTDSFIANIKTEDVYKDIANDVEKMFDTSNYVVEILLPIVKSKTVIRLMNDELVVNTIAEFVGFCPKTYSYFIDDGSGDKKVKETKKYKRKRRLKFQEYKKCLENKEIILRSQQRFKSNAHNILTEKVNKIALSFYDD